MEYILSTDQNGSLLITHARHILTFLSLYMTHLVGFWLFGMSLNILFSQSDNLYLSFFLQDQMLLSMW